MKVLSSRKVKAVTITSSYRNFNGDARKWQEAYFELISMKNYWSTEVLRLDIYENRRGAFVRLDFRTEDPDKPSLYTYGKNAWISLMEDLGYRELNVDDIVYEAVEVDYDENVDEYDIEF